jgi:DNA gyrase/topoisomerase IV subunit A
MMCYFFVLSSILEAYRTGRGRLIVRGKTDVELLDPKTKRTAIIIKEVMILFFFFFFFNFA